MPSLTLAEAQTRSQLITVTRTSVDLDLRGPLSFESRTVLEFDARAGEETFVEFAGAQLLSATLNDAVLGQDAWRDGRIRLSDLAEHNTLVVHGSMTYSHDGEGLHRHEDPADGNVYLYAMSFLDAAPRWFACFDQPDLKCPYSFRVLVPEGWRVLGNAPATSEPSQDGVTWTIECERPLATYFTTVCAGPWASLEREVDGRILGIHAKQSLAAELARESEEIFATTTAAFAEYARLFDEPYGFGDYHQVFVPDFNAGAMENPGCVTLRETMLFRGRATREQRAARAGTIIHELAHQWFGDMVTMRWWDDLWLNESFAEFLAHHVAATATDYDLWIDFGVDRKEWGAVADQSPSTHPVAANGAPDAAAALASFDGISYAKGAAVLRQLCVRMGEPAFFGGLNAYISKYRWANAAAEQLMAEWADASGLDLGAWAQAWLTTSGMDRLEVRGDEVVVVPPEGAPVREHAIDVASLGHDGSELGRASLLATGTQRPDLPSGWLLPDAGDVTWAVVRPDLDHVPPLSQVASAASRVVIHNAVHDTVRAAELDPLRAWEILHRELPVEPHRTILSGGLAFARETLLQFVSPARRLDVLDELRDVAATIMLDAEPGSDRQLIGFRSLVSACRDAEELRAWLNGGHLPDGVELDPDLRWSLVKRIASVTGDEELIEREAERDASASGQIAAAGARAAIPTEEAKERALNLVTGVTDTTPHQLYATCTGLFLPEQMPLVEPFALRWFDEITQAASVRSGWVLNRSVAQSFPVAVTTERVLARAEALVANNPLPVGVQPVLRDGLDRLSRAVASQRRFA